MRRKKEREVEADLDMTTFINVLVVLLAFLLVTSAFSEISQLQVNLPSSGGGAGAEAPKPLVLEVIVYKDRIVVANRQSGPLKVLGTTPNGLDFKGLNDFLTSLKETYPSITEATILLESDTPYDTLIKTMDSVRYKPKKINGAVIRSALFPDIGIGDAPVTTGGA